MLTDHQSEQIKRATTGKLGLFTGTPGSGKTYSIAEWIKDSGISRNNVMCCAPTGKAAIRMSESLRENGLSLEATTIHRALKPQLTSGDGWSFYFSGERRWSELIRLIIVDESSMIDTWLMAKLFSAAPLHAQIIFVGDPNQLPPVGHGKPFKDMIDSEVFPHGHLSEPHRFSGRIGQVCKAIQDGTEWEPSKKIDLELDFPENYRHFECGSSRESQKILLDILDVLKDRYDLNLLNDVQILVPLNAKSDMSRERVNRGLQDKLNPDGEQLDGVPYRKGDKVICLKNGQKPLVDPEGDATSQYVANGEIGIVSSISKVSVSVRFYNSFTVRFPRHDWKGHLALAYGITCHKSQGSGWPAVITVIDEYVGADYVCNRPWVYTAISRASKISLTIGRMSRMRKFLSDPGIDRRITGLRHDLITWKKEQPNAAV